MKSTYFIPIAVLAFAAACSDTATSPTSAGGPLFAVAAGTYTDPLADPQTGIQDANVPSGAHLTNKSGPVQCLVNADFSISCSAYSIGGVGNLNAFLSLEANYAATIDCNNPGKNANNPVESHTSSFSASSSATLTPGRNGTLRVGARSVSPFGVPQVCPNANWQPEIRGGSVTLVSFTYSLLFDGFSASDFAVFIHAQ